MNDQELLDVENFFSGKSIFITGGTGYLGKAVIEKILYSCPDVEKVYILLRDKKGQRAYERISEIINSSGFQRLRSRKYEISTKLIPVSGNISEENLGLTKDVLTVLEKEVSVVFHLAATVNFNEPLSHAMAVNVNGTQEVLKICHRMEKLKAFVHVSTAFSNSDRRDIEEKIYPHTVKLEEVKLLNKCFPDDEIITKKLIGNKPNTYTYTKSLAEELVQQEHGKIPTAIVRPSIVISALEEPAPGWIDNSNGSTGLFLGMSTGVMKVMVGKGTNVTDLIPLDIVVNLIIVAAVNCERSQELKVYNCCTGTSNPVTCIGAEEIARRVTTKYSLNKVPFPFMVFTTVYWLYKFLIFFLQIVPSYIIDIMSIIMKKKPIQLKIQHKISKTVDLMKFFLINEWNFADGNVRSLLNRMTEKDKQTFNFDVKSYTWDKCLEVYVLGIHKYLVKSRK
ncbi:hypothetical protein K1T71_008876 [Dendrolimus kikuchii]|uniref:Uncharacterized protein n=1 Tax=Dendrolimus kikuchii TaxID=765133 RepID=A0ACC1CX79_9NEOP|nr:hypothetical protein K1T71_008876 [Dendrolimus kikuchii]